ncbi:MAG: C45 family peptidase [Chitinophagales bacterium]
MKRLLRAIFFVVVVMFVVVAAFVLYIQYALAPSVPVTNKDELIIGKPVVLGNNFYTLNNCWLRKSNSGLWEEYIEGAPFERGVIAGKLGEALMRKQEDAFVEQIHRLVPNNHYLSFLRYFTRFFNRHLEENVPLEYRQEIYGESLSAPHEYDFLGTPYDRMLNYHAAHDIGHALQSLALVGCTSFAAWDERTTDSTLIIGRNFDFYAGDKFAEDKLVLFVKPDSGHAFAMVTWGGFLGAVSGMNVNGLTVTMNAAKSDIPTASATPISILGREILQYASTIDEAYAIASKRKTFVSETLLIGSAKEHQSALIEKSPTKTALLRTKENYQLCANHYQSDTFKNSASNLDNIKNSASSYRFKRLEELMAANPKLDYRLAAEILRDQRGWHNKNIGIGNEKAMNQLIGHHAVIFQPEKLRMWVSTAPFQLGPFECYDLKKIFSTKLSDNQEIRDTALTIAADTFLNTSEWQRFLQFKQLRETIKEAIAAKKHLPNEELVMLQLVNANPESFESYYWCGRYCQAVDQKKLAAIWYRKALEKEVNALSEVNAIRERISACEP